MSKLSLTSMTPDFTFKNFTNAISDELIRPAALRLRHSQCHTLALQLNFEDLVKILQYIIDNQSFFLDFILKLSEKDIPLPTLHRSPKLPRQITLFQDAHTRQTVLIIFLEGLLANQTEQKELIKNGQTKRGTPCYAITLVRDKLDFFEHFAVKTMDNEKLLSGYEIANMFNSPYMLKYKLLKFPHDHLGLLSVRGLFRLVDIEVHKDLFKYHDLVTICYSLFKGMDQLHTAGITHRDMIANWVIFNDIRLETFYVKMIDFDFAIKTWHQNIIHFNKDLKDIGHVITVRVLNDNNKLLNHCPNELYWKAICDIQNLARALVVCAFQENPLITAQQALKVFLKIIAPVCDADPVLNRKIQAMQNVLEKLPSEQKSFFITDAESLAPTSKIMNRPSFRIEEKESKESIVFGGLNLRRSIGSEDLSLLDIIKPNQDLSNKVYPLSFAISKKKWQCAINLMDIFIFKKLTLTRQTSLMDFDLFPSLNCGLLNLIIEEEKIDHGQRLIMIEKLIELKAEIFYHSSILGSPLKSALRALEKNSNHPEKEYQFWSLIYLLYAKSSANHSYDPDFKNLLKLAFQKHKYHFIAIAMNHLIAADFDQDFLIEVFILAINSFQVHAFFSLVIQKLDNLNQAQLGLIILTLSRYRKLDFDSIELKQSPIITIHDTKAALKIAHEMKNLDLIALLRQYFLLNYGNVQNIVYDTFLYLMGLDQSLAKNSKNIRQLIFTALEVLNPAGLSHILEQALVQKNYWLIQNILDSKKVEIDYKIKEKTLFEWCAENAKWDQVINHIGHKNVEQYTIKRIVRNKPVIESALYWAITDTHVKAVQLICESGFNVDKLRIGATRGGTIKIKKKLPYIFLIIKKLELPYRIPQSNVFSMLKDLLKYTQIINFAHGSYNPSPKSHSKSKYMSHLVKYLIEMEETATLKEFILNRNFLPTLKMHYEFFNFIEYAVMKNKTNILAFFRSEIENLQDFIRPDLLVEHHEIKNPLPVVSTPNIELDNKTEAPVTTEKLLFDTNIISKNTIDNFKLMLNAEPTIANSFVMHPKRQMMLIDFAARIKKWEFVLELVKLNACFNFTMEFWKTLRNDHCSFFQFVLSKSNQSSIAQQIVTILLKKPDLNVSSVSSSNESVLCTIESLLKKDPTNIRIYQKFKQKILKLMPHVPAFSTMSLLRTPQLSVPFFVENPQTGLFELTLSNNSHILLNESKNVSRKRKSHPSDIKQCGNTGKN